MSSAGAANPHEQHVQRYEGTVVVAPGGELHVNVGPALSPLNIIQSIALSPEIGMMPEQKRVAAASLLEQADAEEQR